MKPLVGFRGNCIHEVRLRIQTPNSVPPADTEAECKKEEGWVGGKKNWETNFVGSKSDNGEMYSPKRKGDKPKKCEPSLNDSGDQLEGDLDLTGLLHPNVNWWPYGDGPICVGPLSSYSNLTLHSNEAWSGGYRS